MTIETIGKDILEECKNGDIQAFEYILSVYEKPIYNYCLRIVKDYHHATDITQDTFIKVYMNRKKIDVSKSISSWIYTIATNTAYDFLRSRKGRKSVTLEDGDETFYARATYSTTGDIRTDIENALQKIKEEHRHAITLYYNQGFDYKEIATKLAIPINTVKTYIRRGKQTLKELLKNYEQH